MVDKLTITIGQYSKTGRKQKNEDSYGILIPGENLLKTKGVAMVIADGMSTSEAGKEASEMCVKSFLSDYYATPETVSVKTAAEQTIRALNQWLCAQGQNTYHSNKGMVSTLSAMVLKFNKAYLFHVGDSRIVRIRDGAITSLTRDHRGQNNADQFVLSRAMGVDPHIEVDYKTTDVICGDIFIFTTDGVHDFISADDLLLMFQDMNITTDITANNLCQRIVTKAYDNASPDNLTCQIVVINELDMDNEIEQLNQLLALPFPPPLEVDMIIDGYQIVREIHASPRSQIYLALDQKTGSKVAIKTPSINFNDNPDYILSFQREQWAGRHVKSPHVIKILNPDREQKFLYTVTEYCPGITLRQWMDTHKTASLEQVQNIISQIAKGLRAFHRKEMIHQDIKPDNIIMDDNGHVKIIDFGSIHIANEETTSLSSDSSMCLGTVDYSAPDMLLGLDIDNQADIFSLGVIAYELLSLHLPYGKGFKTPRMVSSLRYIPATELNDLIPPWVDGALRKATARLRPDRYLTLSEFIRDLHHPNVALLKTNKQPLIEKNPVAFWRGTSIILGLVVLFLLYRLNL